MPNCKRWKSQPNQTERAYARIDVEDWWFMAPFSTILATLSSNISSCIFTNIPIFSVVVAAAVARFIGACQCLKPTKRIPTGFYISLNHRRQKYLHWLYDQKALLEIVESPKNSPDFWFIAHISICWPDKRFWHTANLNSKLKLKLKMFC